MRAEVLVARLKAIREPELRRFALLDLLAATHAPDAVGALAEVIRRAHATDDAGAQAVVECLVHAVADLPYETRQHLYSAAHAAEHAPVARLFLDASPPTASEHELEAAMAPERPLRPRDRPLSLGERKSLARAVRRDVLVPLLRDPHPDVVAILLENSHLTEADVVTIAALRPSVPASLILVARHARWSVRYQVKRAIVLNPYTPTHVAVRLATTLRRPDLIELARDLHLPVMLRSQAAELLTWARHPLPS